MGSLLVSWVITKAWLVKREILRSIKKVHQSKISLISETKQCIPHLQQFLLVLWWWKRHLLKLRRFWKKANLNNLIKWIKFVRVNYRINIRKLNWQRRIGIQVIKREKKVQRTLIWKIENQLRSIKNSFRDNKPLKIEILALKSIQLIKSDQRLSRRCILASLKWNCWM